MQRRGYSNLRQSRPAARGAGNPAALQRLGRLLDLKRLDELIKEPRYSVCQFRVGCFGRMSLSDLEPAPIDQVSSVGSEEFVQHFYKVRAFQAPLCALPYIRYLLTHRRSASLQARGAASGQQVAAGDRSLS